MLHIDHFVICAAFNNAKCGWHLDTTLVFFNLHDLRAMTTLPPSDIHCPPQVSLNSEAFGDLSLQKAMKCNYISNASLTSFQEGKLWDDLRGNKLVLNLPPLL